jgi:hypothetical protein
MFINPHLEGLKMIEKPIEKPADANLNGALLDATRNAAEVLPDGGSKVSSGRIKTSDKFQKAVLDFAKS